MEYDLNVALSRGNIIDIRSKGNYMKSHIYNAKNIDQNNLIDMPYMYLDKENRKSNILNAFSVYNVEKIINKRVLIFDDIFTTGATLNECSRILLNNNVKYVGVASLATD